MFLDASIIVAIAMRETGWKDEIARIEASSGPFWYVPTVRFEAVVAMARIGSLATGLRMGLDLLLKAEEIFDSFVENLPAEELAITSDIGRGALAAVCAYGKIVGHPAQLNFGDCFSYAAAKSLGVGLLYKGDDFSRTDLA